MPLAAGTRLDLYEILGSIGAGGMGEVYRARDTKLNRDVAIKVLPELFAADPERLARFVREAQTLAALNHPNIAHIYGTIESGDTHALVMELVDGEDLSAHIARGAVPIADTIAIATQVANALEAAHDQGIVHRDLKPANIKIRPDGTVKVLDFGLAKALSPGGEASGSGGNASNSPTLTAHGTQMGMILGTAAYMAPEQARGKVVDRRADIWAFGVVMYEMLTGRRMFEGEEVSDVLAAVLRQDIDWTRLPANTPQPIRRLLRRCLDKDPRKRLSAIGDARLELDDRDAEILVAPVRPAQSSWLSRLWPAAVAVIVTAAVAAAIWPRTTTTAAGSVTRMSLLSPPGESLYPDSTGVAISPDGTKVAFIVGSVSQSDTQLWVRSLDSMVAHRLDDAQSAVLPFWSPDGKKIGYFSTLESGQLRTISVTGGRSERLADSPNGRGATWNAANVIVFAPEAAGPLFRIPAGGGKPEPVTSLDPAKKEVGHRFPAFLPDGEHFLYASLPGRAGKFEISVGSLTDKSRVVLGSMESAPVYAEPGWLLYSRQGVLAAQRFDLKELKLIGDPIPLPDEPTSILDPAISFTAGRPTSVASDGSMAFYSAPSQNTTAIWFDSNGQKTGALNLPPGHYELFKISPDGNRAAFVRSMSPSESSIWVSDLNRGGAVPITSGHGRNDGPVWSPDGRQIIFSADREGPQNFYVKTLDDAAPERLVYQTESLFKNPTAWGADGQILMTQLDPGTAQNVYRFPAAGGGTTLLVRGSGRDNAGDISPNGKWFWYASDETGSFEVYVMPYPGPGPRIKVSEQGAAGAWWTRDGKQMVLLGADMHSLWRMDIETGPTFHADRAKLFATLPADVIWVDATPDGKRFLVVAPERTGVGSMTVVTNWLTGLGGR